MMTTLVTPEQMEFYRGFAMRGGSLLHPRQAIRICDDIRRQHSNDDVPDNIILRTILNQRRNAVP